MTCDSCKLQGQCTGILYKDLHSISSGRTRDESLRWANCPGPWMLLSIPCVVESCEDPRACAWRRCIGWSAGLPRSASEAVQKQRASSPLRAVSDQGSSQLCYTLLFISIHSLSERFTPCCTAGLCTGCWDLCGSGPDGSKAGSIGM